MSPDSFINAGWPRLIAIPQRRDVIRRFIDRFSPSRATASRQILIAV